MKASDPARRRIVQYAIAFVPVLTACSVGEAAAPSFEPLFDQTTVVDSGADGPTAVALDPATADPTDAGVDDAPASYLAAESVIRTQCAFVRCHGGPTRGGAGLWFDQTGSIRSPLVNVPACEYNKMTRVKPGDVFNSWMIIKLSAPQDPETHAISFSPESDWMPNPTCGLAPADASGRFGLRMPMTNFQLDPDDFAKLTAWIAEGAPGPTD